MQIVHQHVTFLHIVWVLLSCICILYFILVRLYYNIYAIPFFAHNEMIVHIIIQLKPCRLCSIHCTVYSTKTYWHHVHGCRGQKMTLLHIHTCLCGQYGFTWKYMHGCILLLFSYQVYDVSSTSCCDAYTALERLLSRASLVLVFAQYAPSNS